MNIEIRNQRFWAKVTKGNDTDCWEWSGYRNDRGYGKYGGEYAHRISYAIHNGPLELGKHIDHMCGNRACVNPSHLDQVRPVINLRRAAVKRRKANIAANPGKYYRPHRFKKVNFSTIPVTD